MQRGLPVVIFVLAPLAVLGGAGEIPLAQLSTLAVHHLFHIVFPVVAFAVFALFVARDISKHGWPTFSWRLNATR
jgi:hypothetical protein